MRQDFVLVRGPADQARFAQLHDLAAHIHALRGERPLHLKSQAIGHSDGEEGPCVAIRAGVEREALIGYALFPEARAYLGEDARLRLAKALLDQRPDAQRSFDGERLGFHHGKAA